MKHQLLLSGLFIGLGMSLLAQSNSVNPVKFSPVDINKSAIYLKGQGALIERNVQDLPFDKINSTPSVTSNPRPIVPFVQNANYLWNGTSVKVGSTYYDMQTNSSVQNRLVKSPDGTISAVWTFGPMQHKVFPDRGTGYNYYDGANWGAIPTARIEAQRTGWPCIVVTDSGEVVVSHNTGVTQLHVARRTTTGSGAWTESTTDLTSPAGGNLWPRMVSGGKNGRTIHLISVTSPAEQGGPAYKGMNGALLYSRSKDGGATWDKLHVDIPGLDSSAVIGVSPDDYAIDVKDSVVAILVGGNIVDLMLFKSMDEGETWTMTVIDTFPIPLYNPLQQTTDIDNDGDADTIFFNDGSVEVLIDNNGKAHIWTGYTAIVQPTPGPSYGYFPFVDSLQYWNENMGAVPPKAIAGVIDINNNLLAFPATSPPEIGVGTYYLGLSSMPTAGIDASGNIYVAYASCVDSSAYSNANRAFRHTYITRSGDGGNTWEHPLDVSLDLNPPDTYYEVVFPSMYRDVDTHVHLIYQKDFAPGHSMSGAAGAEGTIDPANVNAESEIHYVAVPVGDLINVGIKENSTVVDNISIFPNPASDFISISYMLKKSSNIDVIISNIVGQTIDKFSNKAGSAGNHQLNIDVSKYTSGVYFVTSVIGDETFTNKIIVR